MLDKLLFKYIGNAKIHRRERSFDDVKGVRQLFDCPLSRQNNSGSFFRRIVWCRKCFSVFGGISSKVRQLISCNKISNQDYRRGENQSQNRDDRKAMRIGPAYLNHTSTANMINMGSDTIEQLENYYGRFLPQFFGSFGMSLVTFSVLFS